MPDWKRIVREQMSSPKSPRKLNEQVVSELAAHLEETFEAALSQGSTERAAVELALQEVDDWQVLGGKIRDAKSQEDHMNQRTKSLWLPVMISILGASLAMTLIQKIGVRPRLVWTGPAEMGLYFPWVAVLPLFGALGAYLSRRAGGVVWSRVTAALAPVLWLGGLGCLTEPVELASRGFSHLPYFAYGMVEWVALPAFALLIGAAPFLREPRALETQRSKT
jgi:hypothetical protein